MATLPMVLIIVASVLLFAIPIIASFALCVPKWWEQKVSPLFPERPYSTRPHNPWYYAPFRWSWVVLRFMVVVLIGIPGAAIITTILGYILAWGVWIERKCPYTPADTQEEYYSQNHIRERWLRDWREVFGDLWDTAMGR